jgi:predicted dehydrogenase
MIGIAVVGYGYWGPNLVRNFSLVDGARVVAVVDQRPDRRATVEKLYPTVRTYAEVADMLVDPDVDAVVIASPLRCSPWPPASMYSSRSR